MFIAREIVPEHPNSLWDTAIYTLLAGESLYKLECLDDVCESFEAIFEEASSHPDT
jgi:hypothetical protein